jgi:predicted nucleotidyltransferase
MKFIDLQRDIAASFAEYRQNFRKYAYEIKKMALEYFGDNFLKLLVFGSTVKGNYRADSDIDIAIILMKNVDEFQRAKFVSIVNKKFKLNPFEIHIISNDLWESWYKNFVKNEFIEI